MTTDTQNYCRDLVRAQDPDRFLLSMVMPPQHRSALWALFAFNHEVAKTREVVTETQLGLIRLQWWRDALEGIYERGEVPEHEILRALAQAIAGYKLPRELFEDVLYAREFDLEDVLPSDLSGMANYAEFTNAPLNRLVSSVLGEDHDDKAVKTVSRAYGLTGLLRAVPYHCSQRRCYLPEDLITAQGIRMDHVYDFKAIAPLKPVTRAVAEQIEQDLSAAGKLPKGYLKASKIMTRIYLEQIKSSDYDIFAPQMARPPHFFHLRFLTGISL